MTCEYNVVNLVKENIGSFKIASCDRFITEKKKCRLLPASSPKTMNTAEYWDYDVRDVDKFIFKCPRSSKSFDGDFNEVLVVNKTMQCYSETKGKSTVLSCTCEK